MRKIVSVVVVLLAGLLQPVAPLLAATLQVDALPACCRAHGKHHCLMAANMMAAMMTATEKETSFRAPRCPYSRAFQILPGTVALAGRPSSLSTPLQAVLHLTALTSIEPDSRAYLHRNPRAPPVS
ncbi:MAG: hypothetical protein ACYC46_12090 [Acidobacteriaceae bacterium]